MIKTVDQIPRFWIGVASKDHVENGVATGICQFCHGKSGPTKRLKKSDYIIYYSSKHTMVNKEPYKKFTAIGIIKDDEIYQVQMKEGFFPYRRNVEYFKEAKHIDIIPLIPHLNFIKNKKSWGYVFKFGFLEIDKESFVVIAKEMLGFVPVNIK